MPKRKSFLLRIDPSLYDALHKWADDELRSVNGQIEFLLAGALKKAGRWPPKKKRTKAPPEPGSEE